MQTFLRTSHLVKAVGIHPNTARRYMDRNLIPPVERSPAGYRRFTQIHLDCLRLTPNIRGDRKSLPARVLVQSKQAGFG